MSRPHCLCLRLCIREKLRAASVPPIPCLISRATPLTPISQIIKSRRGGRPPRGQDRLRPRDSPGYKYTLMCKKRPPYLVAARIWWPEVSPKTHYVSCFLILELYLIIILFIFCLLLCLLPSLRIIIFAPLGAAPGSRLFVLEFCP